MPRICVLLLACLQHVQTDGQKEGAMRTGLQMASHIILGIWRRRKSDLEVYHG